MKRASRWNMIWIRTGVAAVTTLLMLLAVGCGPKGPVRYDISGKVTYKGQPVPAGEVILTPDTAQGNSGPGSWVMINEGTYATLPGQGIVGGPYIVEILGYDQPPAGEGSEGGTALFEKQRIEMTFPLEDTEIDLNLPPEG